MIFIHSEDSSPCSINAIAKFFEGLSDQKSHHVDRINHFTGSLWQNPVNRIQLASVVAEYLIEGHSFILHHDSDQSYSDYLNHFSNPDFESRTSAFWKLKKQVSIVLDSRGVANKELLLTRFVRFVAYMDLESVFLINKNIIPKYIHSSLRDSSEVKSIMEFPCNQHEEFSFKAIVLKRSCGKKGKDVFNLDLVENYPYSRLLSCSKSFRCFYDLNRAALKLKSYDSELIKLLRVMVNFMKTFSNRIF